METLKEHRSRALLRHLNMASVPLKTVIAGRDKFLTRIKAEGYPVEAKPEQEALWFYLRNHAMASLSHVYDAAEPLGEYVDVATAYHREVQVATLRMYYYLLQICTREARHAKNPDTVYALYPELKAWHASYRGAGSNGAVAALLNNTPDVSVGRLTSFLCDIFYKCSYQGGYGGKAWGGIADVLKQFVHGEITGEMMMDTAFTLCHNNGPIFNKGMWYASYDPSIGEILDVQRAGLIPQYIGECIVGGELAAKYRGRGHVTKPMFDFVQRMRAVATDFRGEIDWKQVKALGALGDYSHLIKAQSLLKPKTPAEIAAEKKAAELAAAKKANEWQIMPGITAQKTKPVRLAAAA